MIPCRCEVIKVRTSGNKVVDRVRERLSYNDIYGSSQKERLAKEDPKTRAAFNSRLYDIITQDLSSSIKEGCLDMLNQCINSVSKPGEPFR